MVNVLGWFRSSRWSPGAQCSCIRLETPYARLVLLTFAAGSEVSVVIKHEIQFVWGIFNRHSWSHESIICSWSYRFWLSKKVYLHIFILYFTVVQRWLSSIRLTELFAFVFISSYISLLYFYNGYYCSLIKLTFNKKRQSYACCALLSMAPSWHTPRLSSKGTVGVSQAGSGCAIPNRTVPYCPVPLSGHEPYRQAIVAGADRKIAFWAAHVDYGVLLWCWTMIFNKCTAPKIYFRKYFGLNFPKKVYYCEKCVTNIFWNVFQKIFFFFKYCENINSKMYKHFITLL